jgi:hypothetical protein
MKPLLKELLESEDVLKITHDCREDSSCLFSTLDIKLNHVFDTQVAYKQILNNKKEPVFLPSLEFLKQKYLNAPPGPGVDMKDPNLWMYRPISDSLQTYAAGDVKFLIDLKKALTAEGKCVDSIVVEQSQQYVNYRHMNLHIRTKKGLYRRGQKIKAMLVSRAVNGVYFKLNCGSSGLAMTPSSIQDFDKFDIGDQVDCFVNGWTPMEDTVFLNRFK